MPIRNQAQGWLRQNHPDSINNQLRCSKHYPEQGVWWLTFPLSFCEPTQQGKLNILLQNASDISQFHFVKVPFEFFQKNRNNFDVTGDKFNLHISSKQENWLECERSNNVSFANYEQ